MGDKSSVGEASLYEAGDQRNVPQSEIDAAKKEDRFHEGKENSHQANDPKDERSIANKLARETKRAEDEEQDDFETRVQKEDPTQLAKLHGNEPSKGAKVDKDLQDEEAELIKKMDAKKGK